MNLYELDELIKTLDPETDKELISFYVEKRKELLDQLRGKLQVIFSGDRESDNSPWRFVEKWYPNYNDQRIGDDDSLLKLMDEEYEDGDHASQILEEWYDGEIHNPKIKRDYVLNRLEIYERAIKGYLQNG